MSSRPAKRPNCPACGSPKVTTLDPDQIRERVAEAAPETTVRVLRLLEHHGTLQICPSCKAAWEPLPPGEPRHPEEPNMSFPEPCDNCAFRPGSPEVEDRAEWKKLLTKLKHGGRFYCHKGVPLGGEDGFQYPKKADGTHDEGRMRLCRGFLNAWAKWEWIGRVEGEELLEVCSTKDAAEDS